MRMRKQAFLTHYEEIADDYRIIWYSDVNCANLYTHSHGYFEMYYLVSGRVVYCTGGCKFFLQPDDILFINRGQEHHPVLVEPSVPYERILLHVAPQTLRELSTNEIDLAECFTRNNFTVYHYPKNVRDSIRQFFDRLSALKGSGRFGQQILGRAYLAELFVEINQYNHNKTIFSFDEDTMNDQKMRMVRQYVRAHAAEPITVDDLADYLYMSRSHLMRQFRENAGVSLYQFIIKTRLQLADGLIRGGLSYTEASLQSGFGDYSNYYRAFLREYGVSPREFYHHSIHK